MQDIERVALQRDAQALGLEEAPLVAGLGLLLGRQRAAVLGARHLAGGQAREGGGHHGHDHRCGGENPAEERLRHGRFQSIGNVDLCHGRMLTQRPLGDNRSLPPARP
jgi:hypothetical protein